MAIFLYRNAQMEQDLLKKISAAATKHYGGDIPPEVQERIATDTRHIVDNGHGTPLAIAAFLAEYSAAHGYPVGIQGHIGDLHVSHLLGIAVLDPLELGLRLEGCLGLDGTRMPEVALNVAPELLNGLRRHLRELLPDCDILFGPGVPFWKIVVVPRKSGVYDSANEYLDITLYPHELMGRAGKVQQRADGIAFDEELIASTYMTDEDDFPLLKESDETLDFANMLAPKTFSDLVKVVGLCRAWKAMFQVYRTPLLPDRFEHFVGAQEDIYDMCVRLGIDGGDAFRIMQQALGGKLTQGYRNMLATQGASDVLLETLDNASQLHPRGQLADEVYWALMALAHRTETCRA